MQHSDIKFKKDDRVVRVVNVVGDCRMGTKWIVEDVSSDGKWIAISSALDCDHNPEIRSYYAAYFKLLMTCEPRLIGMHPDHGAPYGEQL